jgi:hypothetical protein
LVSRQENREKQTHNKICGGFAQQQRNNAKAEVFIALLRKRKGLELSGPFTTKASAGLSRD